MVPDIVTVVIMLPDTVIVVVIRIVIITIGMKRKST